MLEIRPSCEHCNKDLPADSPEACICSYECTFCRDCVDTVLENVCPNCGGGFSARPIRPEREWRAGLSRAIQVPASERTLKPVDRTEHKLFAAPIKTVLPVNR